MTAAPADGTVLARLDHVARRFDNGRVALADVSLEVRAGEVLALVGPSGCGKSTLLRLLAGLDVPSAGRLERGPGLADAPPGFVFQDGALPPWSRARDAVALPLRLRGVPRAGIAPRVEAALRAVGLADAADAYPHELSGGMRMRVALARALVDAPRAWLLDEPFGALDEITRFALNQLLLELCAPHGDRPAASAVFVTHSVYEAVFLSRRVLVLARPGRVVAEIAVDEPGPRTAAFRTTGRFTAACAAVSAALQRASEAAP